MIEADRLEALALQAGLTEPSIVLEPAGRSGAGVTVAPERALYPASMIKVPIAMALAERVRAGGASWAGKVPVDETHLTTNDAPSPFVLGYEARLDDLMHAMIAKSDNVATNVLIDLLGRASIGPACAPFGLKHTAVHRKLSGSLPLIDDPAATGRNVHPAADAAALFHEIYRRSHSGADPLFHALGDQIWNDKLPSGLRPGDRFAHKTGDTDESSHDGGILELEDGRAFVLVVYTALAAIPENDARFAAFARNLRPYLDA